MAGSRARWLVVVVALAAACSGGATLSGEVSVVKAGEVKRAVDVDVVLVAATDAFNAEWAQVVESFQAERARVQAASAEADRLQAHAKADRVAASQATQDLVRNSDDIDWRTYDQVKQRHNAAFEQALKALQRSRAAHSQLEALRPRQRREGWDVIRKYLVKQVRTDARGRFAFTGVAPGRYVLASHWQVSGDDVYWFVPLELAPGAQQATELTDRNAGWPLS